MTSPTPNMLNAVANANVSSRPFIEVFLPRDPTPQDMFGNGGPFQVQQRWWNTTTNNEFILVGFSSAGGVVTANWQGLEGSGSEDIETITGNTGGPVGPDASGNINFTGAILYTTDGNPGTNSLVINPRINAYPATPYVVGAVDQAGYQTIQSAITAASLAGGGLVLIQPGIYTETLTISSTNVSLASLGSPIIAGGASTEVGVAIKGSLNIDSTLSGIGCTFSNILFEATTATPAVSFTNPANEINASWFGCTFQGISGTAFDCVATSGISCVMENCMFKASTGQKCMNLDGVAINVISCSSETTDTASTIAAGKNFFVNCFFQDSFDISNNPGPFIFSGGTLLAISNMAAAIIRNGVTAFFLNSSVAASSLSGYIFESGGALDAGTIFYAAIPTPFGSSTIDPLLTQNPVNTIPFSTAGTSLTAVKGNCGFAATDFTVADGFVSLLAPGTTAITAVNIQTFTSSGTYTPTTDMKYCIIECVGGGGGGGALAGATTESTAAGGGGSGGYARGVFSAASVGVSQVVTIGAAGTAGSGGNNPGGAGGTSIVGGLISASGGQGGNSFPSATGGSGGAGSVGNFQTTGAPGGFGFYWRTGGIVSDFGTGGVGGSSFFGGGAPAVASPSGGAAATSYGGGGGGAAADRSGTGQDGGAGFAGIVVITEYI